MAFTEFCCRSGGSNLNSGTRTGDSTEPGTAAFKTYTSGTWVQATRTYTPPGGANPITDGIAVNDFVSIYPDAATVSPYVARITTVGTTTFQTSATAFSGTAPVDGAVNTSASIGGAWKGPNAAENFPFNFVTNVLTNAAGAFPRINLKNAANYNITAAITHSLAGPTRFQGYTTSYGDAGQAIIDGGTSGASYILIALSGANNALVDIIFQNNGATGSVLGANISGAESLFRRCVVNNIRGSGADFGSNSLLAECEAYLCNTSNTAGNAGFTMGAGASAVRCISHDNAGSNSSGFLLYAGSSVLNCIADTNGAIGFNLTSPNYTFSFGCDAYNNVSDGIRIGNASAALCYIENCNLVKNGGYGINGSGAGSRNGTILNCGFGSGTQANSSGTTTGLSAIVESGSITYASNVTPWVDPANGDFRINLAAAINAGRGSFVETQAAYAGTIGYPDIGAAQHLETVATHSTSFVG